jgi:DNA-binding transcriptional LysR family regulator
MGFRYPSAQWSLGVSSPTVSEVIADLERALGARLLDCGAQGVEPTTYGRAILKRGLAAFDELKQGSETSSFYPIQQSENSVLGAMSPSPQPCCR